MYYGIVLSGNDREHAVGVIGSLLVVEGLVANAQLAHGENEHTVAAKATVVLVVRDDRHRNR